MDAGKSEQVTIKKYANRRLYNTGTSTYVTLEDLAEMVKKGEEFTVQDAKTGEDITHSVLTQIIFELENKAGQNMLPIAFLRQLISFYGDQMQMVLPSFLEQSMDAFAREQERMREQLTAAFGKGPMMGIDAPMKMIEDQVQAQHGDVPECHAHVHAVRYGPVVRAKPAPGDKPDNDGAQDAQSDDIRELRDQIAAMQRKIDSLDK